MRYLVILIIFLPFLGNCQIDSKQYYFDNYSSEYGLSMDVIRVYNDTIINTHSYDAFVLIDDFFVDTMYLRELDSIVYCWHPSLGYELPFYSRQLENKIDTFYLKKNNQIVMYYLADTLCSINFNGHSLKNVLLMRAVSPKNKIEFLFHSYLGFIGTRRDGNLIWWPSNGSLLIEDTN